MRVLVAILLLATVACAQDEPRVVTDQDRAEVAAILKLSQQLGAENRVLKDELLSAQRAHISGLSETVTAQATVIALNDDRNAQAKLKDDALDKIDVLNKEISALKLHIAHLKWIICSAIGGVAVLLCLWLKLPAVPGWGLWATIAAFPLVFGLAWAFF